MTANRAQWIVQNDILLERLSRETGKAVRSFDGWKAIGRFVRRGQRQKAFQVCYSIRETIHEHLSQIDITDAEQLHDAIDEAAREIVKQIFSPIKTGN